MNNKFDELAKGLAQSVTRRQALKRFGVGLAGMALACFGFTNKAGAGHYRRCFKACMDTCVPNCESLGNPAALCQSTCTDSCTITCVGI
jgi:hypothetical protein